MIHNFTSVKQTEKDKSNIWFSTDNTIFNEPFNLISQSFNQKLGKNCVTSMSGSYLLRQVVRF